MTGVDAIGSGSRLGSWLSQVLLLDAGGSQGGFSEEGETGLQEKEDHGSVLVCLLCRNTITSEEMKISCEGSHVHTLFNPHGVVFELGCFSEAPGCFSQGPGTSDFSWFKGYVWEYALCDNCGEHLGWHYVAAGADFFGLILNKIALKEV